MLILEPMDPLSNCERKAGLDAIIVKAAALFVNNLPKVIALPSLLKMDSVIMA